MFIHFVRRPAAQGIVFRRETNVYVLFILCSRLATVSDHH